MRTIAVIGAITIAGALLAAPAHAQSVPPAEVRAIAKDAVIWGFPLVDSYRVQYSYFVDRGGAEYKAPWNTLVNNARVYTPDDKAIQTPNSDTPYSFVGADLRAEPLVITVPAIDKGRYYSIQFIDMYTFNFAYVGSRATGNGAGSFLLAGPDWNGTKPANVKAVIRSETEFAFLLIRTQLFNPGDIDNVKKIQAGYKVQTLSQFLGRPAPAPAPTINFPKPLDGGRGAHLARFLQRAEFHPAVLPDQSGRGRAAGAFRQDRHQCRQEIRSRQRSRPGCVKPTRTAWPTPGKPLPNSRRRNSTPDCGPAPTVSARGRS